MATLAGRSGLGPAVVAGIVGGLIYFDGDEYNNSDPWWRESLTIRLRRYSDSLSQRIEWRGAFDIALQPRPL
jgi:hypothetical protein